MYEQIVCVDKCKGRTGCTRVPPTGPLENAIEIVRNYILIKRSNNVFDRGTRGPTRPHIVSRKWKRSRSFWTFTLASETGTDGNYPYEPGVRLLDSFAVRDIHRQNGMIVSGFRTRVDAIGFDRSAHSVTVGAVNRCERCLFTYGLLGERLIRKSVSGR